MLFTFFYGDKQKFQTQAQDLIIWGKDEGKEMGFPKLYFHYHFVIIITWKGSFIVGWLGLSEKDNAFIGKYHASSFPFLFLTLLGHCNLFSFLIIWYTKMTSIYVSYLCNHHRGPCKWPA
jgi:hypothetical protein